MIVLEVSRKILQVWITCDFVMMKKRYIGFFIVCLLLLTISGCDNTKNQDKTGIEKAVDELYEADYDYEIITETFYKDADTYTKVVSEGQVFNNPYKEHFKVVLSDNEPIAKEIYYDKTWIFGSVRAHILTNDGWVLQTVSRSQPAGYGKKLQYKFDREENMDGKNVEIYSAEYTENVSKLYQIQEDLAYTIKQEYYLDKERQILIRIVSDWTDCNEKTAIANDMSANGVTLEQAQNNVKLLSTLQQKYTLNIFNFGNATEFEWPEFK